MKTPAIDKSLQADFEPGAMTIAQFCQCYRIDRTTLYKMRRDGNGPDVLLIGRKVLIPLRSAREWEARMTVRSDTKLAEATVEQREHAGGIDRKRTSQKDRPIDKLGA